MSGRMKRWLGASVCCFILGCGQSVMAQQVVFPQEVQANKAQLESQFNQWTLKNALLTAKFAKVDDKLIFNGCEEMNLKAGTELFKVVLGNGSSFTSSQMDLVSVETEELVGNKLAAKGSDRFSGKALKAEFKKDNLHITWRAVLRDGSHYLRTTLDVSTDADIAMQSITPMIYNVDNSKALSVPVVVGNTRGSLLVSDKIFAGLETPMGVNTAEVNNTVFENFNPKAWNSSSFSWTPGDELPETIRKYNGKVDGKKFSPDDVRGTRGYVSFRKAGSQTLTFQYTSGNHRLDIMGVDVLDGAGKVLASDYHAGYTGEIKSKNVYTLNIPKTGAYVLRYFVAGAASRSDFSSNGSITFSEKISVPVVVYDLVEKQSEEAANMPNAVRYQAAAGENLFDVDDEKSIQWTPDSWTVVASDDIPWRVKEQDQSYPYIKAKIMDVSFTTGGGTFKTTFTYQSGNHRLNMVGVDLLDASNSVVASEYHAGYTGDSKEGNEYSFTVPNAGQYKLRLMVTEKGETITSSGKIDFTYTKVDTLHMLAPTDVPMLGYWRRNTTLKKSQPWEVSSVVGLVAPGQARRSFLAYSERERAVPWRAFPLYNSWYELNIDRNNAVGNRGIYNPSDPENKNGNYSGNMTSAQCVDVVKHWKDKFYNTYKKAPYAFVFDDGWDAYGTWTFNSNFPNGFKEEDKLAKSMGVGIGAWLGPVGGYGGSGTYRRNYWSSRGGMQLSNETYYKYFIDCCNNMIKNYDFRFFKFDGISAQGTAFGPDNGDTGIENAEGIISIEREVRKTRPDIFFNTTVGTWASPFWFHYSDAIWRQDADCSRISNTGTDREQWITYRDYMVYKIFTQGSPLCPINTLMTHGLILSKRGKPYTPSDYSYNGVLREMRCAFGCGSGMVELYTDYSLMDEINGGALWKDLADCMDWQERNADVLPDIHWVGGNPWDGSKVNVYGWASWNGKKTTLTLRNPDVKERQFGITLREAFDIPAYIKTTITLSSSFADQKVNEYGGIRGLDMNKPINIDERLVLNLPASSVFVFEGVDNGNFNFEAVPTTPAGIDSVKTPLANDDKMYDLSGRRISTPQKGNVVIVGGKKKLYYYMGIAN